MRVEGLTSGGPRPDSIRLLTPFLGVETVVGLRLVFEARGRHRGFQVPLVMIDRPGLIQTMTDQLHRLAWSGDLADHSRVASARDAIGRRRFSELIPDIGGGRSGVLGKRRIFFPTLAEAAGRAKPWDWSSFLDDLVKSAKDHQRRGAKLTWRSLCLDGAFPPPKELPSRQDMQAAEEFFSVEAPTIAELDRRLRLKFAKQEARGRDDTRREIDKLLRRRGLGLTGRRAATLLSLLHRVREGNDIAREIKSRIPPAILDQSGSALFDLLWIGDDDHDGHGRFVLPLFGSPAPVSVAQTLVFNDRGALDRHDVLRDAVRALRGGPLGRGALIAAGALLAYRAWLLLERDTDRRRKGDTRRRLSGWPF